MEAKIIMKEEREGCENTIKALREGIPIVIWAGVDCCMNGEYFRSDIKLALKKTKTQIFWANFCSSCACLTGYWGENYFSQHAYIDITFQDWTKHGIIPE